MFSPQAANHLAFLPSCYPGHQHRFFAFEQKLYAGTTHTHFLELFGPDKSESIGFSQVALIGDLGKVSARTICAACGKRTPRGLGGVVVEFCAITGRLVEF